MNNIFVKKTFISRYNIINYLSTVGYKILTNKLYIFGSLELFEKWFPDKYYFIIKVSIIYKLGLLYYIMFVYFSIDCSSIFTNQDNVVNLIKIFAKRFWLRRKTLLKTLTRISSAAAIGCTLLLLYHNAQTGFQDLPPPASSCPFFQIFYPIAYNKWLILKSKTPDTPLPGMQLQM